MENALVTGKPQDKKSIFLHAGINGTLIEWFVTISNTIAESQAALLVSKQYDQPMNWSLIGTIPIENLTNNTPEQTKKMNKDTFIASLKMVVSEFIIDEKDRKMVLKIMEKIT